MKMNPGKIAAATAGLLVLAGLSGCDWFSPKPQPETTANAQGEADVENMVVPAEAPPPAAPLEAANAAAEAEARETPPDPDAQTLDDADATGMTAHVRRDGAPANETTP